MVTYNVNAEGGLKSEPANLPDFPPDVAAVGGAVLVGDPKDLVEEIQPRVEGADVLADGLDDAVPVEG